MDLGTAIKYLRKQRKLSQKELAELTDISINAICQIELNATFPQKKNISKICDALNVPVSYLLFLSITEEDVPLEKRLAFDSLKGAVTSVLLSSET